VTVIFREQGCQSCVSGRPVLCIYVLQKHGDPAASSSFSSPVTPRFPQWKTHNQIIDAILDYFSTQFTFLQCRLIVSQMSSTRCELFNWLIIPAGLVTAVSLMLPSTTGASAELGMLYALGLITTVAHVHYGTCVVCARYLNTPAINSLKPDIHLNNI
jgi:hypothetical protein